MKTILKLTFLTAIVTLLSGVLIQPSLVAAAALPTAPNSGAGASASYNWAGYTATGADFTAVNGSWMVPEATAASNSNLSADATWIGIGGISGNDLIQVGTQAIFSNGQATYQTWYELLPNASQNIAMTVNPGDFITASLNEQAANQWSVSLRDNTTGQNFQTVVSYNSSRSSAEWVEEMPTQTGSGFIPLDNFGAAQFSNSSAVENGNLENLSALNAQPLTMLTTTSQALATVSAIGSDGASFTVTRTGVAAASGVGGFGGGRGGYRRVGRGAQGFGSMPGPQSQPPSIRSFSRFRFHSLQRQNFGYSYFFLIK